MVLALNDDDLNGECFILGSEGEREEINRQRFVCLPVAANLIPNTVTDMTVPANVTFWNNFVITNYEDQIVQGVAPRDARRVAYIRMLAARTGMFKWNDTPGQHNVRYAEFIERAAVGDDIADWDADDAWRATARDKLMDMVCMVAYFFRVRGHHWTADFEDRYQAVWRKCQYEEDSPGISWQLIAHNALHAIYPDDLDQIWINAVHGSICSGALKKRINSKPAGMASVSALNSGVADLLLVVPRAFDYMPAAIDHLKNITRLTEGDENRWNGSVNRRFYNAVDIQVNESSLGALAALIIASLDQFAPNSPLRNSMALKRIAANAPLTGAVVARMIRTAVSSDAAAEIFLPEAPPAPVQGNP